MNDSQRGGSGRCREEAPTGVDERGSRTCRGNTVGRTWAARSRTACRSRIGRTQALHTAHRGVLRLGCINVVANAKGWRECWCDGCHRASWACNAPTTRVSWCRASAPTPPDRFTTVRPGQPTHIRQTSDGEWYPVSRGTSVDPACTRFARWRMVSSRVCGGSHRQCLRNTGPITTSPPVDSLQRRVESARGR
jgi:hypothetical protein